jgi:predicted phage terminase large subunit-like protein
VQSWDTALKDKTTNDFTVGHVWGVLGAQRYLLRKVKGRWDLPETIFQVRSQAAWVEESFPHLPHVILVENAANGPEVIAKLRGKVGGVIGVNVEKDKTTRAQVASVPLEAGNVFIPGPDLLGAPAWALELVDEAAGFPNAAHDDDVDAFTQAINWIKANPGRFEKAEEPRPEDRRAVTAGVLDLAF